MPKLSRRELLTTASATGVALATRSFSFPVAPESFEFVYFSDTHVALDRNIKENAEMFTAIKGESSPAFAINGGDVTDYGWAGEYDNYQKLKDEFGIKTYENMGNHDVRWSPQGEKIFKERLGPSYQFFIHQGVFFAVLDSTVPLSHWGHVTNHQLGALLKQLENLPKGTPVILAIHHWVGRDQVMIFNELDLLQVIRPFNIKLILTGHGHNDLLWKWDTYQCTMNRGLYQGSWQTVEVDRTLNEIRLARYTKETGTLKLLTQIPLEYQERPAIHKSYYITERNSADFRVNDKAWQPIAELEKLSLIDGENLIYFRNEEGLAWYQASPPGSPLLLKARSLQSESSARGEVMSHLTPTDDGQILVSTLGGQLFAYTSETNRYSLTFKADGYSHSTPASDADRVYVGFSTGAIRAYNRKSKAIDWQTKINGPAYAGFALAQDNVIHCGGDGIFHAFDAKTGESRWQTPMPKSNTAFSQSVPCTDGTRVYITCWDSHIYCLDAKTGEIVWRKPCQERTFAFSPAIGSPCLDDDSVYCVANGNGLFRFNKLTGEQHYEVAAPGDKFGHSSPVHHAGRIYAGGLGDNGSVWCVSAKTGEIIWECKTGSVIYDSSPTIGHGLLAIGNAEGILNVIRTRDGKLLTQHRLGGLFLSTPLIHNRKLYAATFRGILHTFDLSVLIASQD
ncbi:MAG: PQQ-binding-like beta-propeller repeat protein [Fimbriimonadaceae bacterium]|nr:MAG: PQQ-binding-like beta-propeller repeat protein [Fimbriimonadaceae bacterium]